MLVYWAGQFLGGYAGSGLAVSLYYCKILTWAVISVLERTEYSYWTLFPDTGPFVNLPVDFKDIIPKTVFRPAASFGIEGSDLKIPFGITFYDQVILRK